MPDLSATYHCRHHRRRRRPTIAGYHRRRGDGRRSPPSAAIDAPSFLWHRPHLYDPTRRGSGPMTAGTSRGTRPPRGVAAAGYRRPPSAAVDAASFLWHRSYLSYDPTRRGHGAMTAGTTRPSRGAAVASSPSRERPPRVHPRTGGRGSGERGAGENGAR